jgi:HJR/Mrr/RecB family endonuclease
MNKELEVGDELLEYVHDFVDTVLQRRLQTTKRHWPSFAIHEQYEYQLPRYDIPRRLELMVESALYALYVAWSPQSRIILPDTRAELLRAMAVDEAAVRILTPRRFEEVIAFIYEQLGCRAQLTKATADWGADVLAWQPGPFGTESLIVVQAKLYSQEHKVTLEGVHALHGAVTHYNAVHGHLVATSDLTGPARTFMDEVGYRFIDLATIRSEVVRLLG